MKLKTATTLACVCLTLWLILSLLSQTAMTGILGPVSYARYRWVFGFAGMFLTLLHAVPLIIFFLVLRAKQ